MGYYDGLGSTNLKASSYDVARITDTPVILVINCKGMSLSIVPIIKGFKDYVINSNIKGVILNNMSKMIYNEIKEVIEKELEVEVIGYIPDLKELTIESRHLGLVTPNDILDIKEKLNKLAEVLEETLNIDGIIELANTVSSLRYNDVQVKKVDKKIKIAVAYDEAFCFYYEDNIQVLRDMGAEVVYFSPIKDSELPKDCSGIIIGGGYPELYAKELSENISMKNSIKVAIENGLPTIAECGGFMYLNQSLEDINGNIFEMIGLIKGNSYRTNKLGRFGYIELIAKEDNYLLKKGEKTLAHEFHYWDSTCCGNKFIATKTLRNRNWDCINIYKNLIAGYPHIHFYSNLNIPFNFLSRCNDFLGGNI